MSCVLGPESIIFPRLMTELDDEVPFAGGPDGLLRGGGVRLSYACCCTGWGGNDWYGAKWLGLLLDGDRLRGLSSPGNVLGGGSRIPWSSSGSLGRLLLASALSSGYAPNDPVGDGRGWSY